MRGKEKMKLKECWTKALKHTKINLVRIWFYPWVYLLQTNRTFTLKMVGNICLNS